MITETQLREIAGRAAKQSILRGVADGLKEHGDKFGLNAPHRLAHFIPQICHESAGFKVTAEYASGAAYEGRKDLGNVRRGDGRKFKGHGVMQVTGRANHREFTIWVRKHYPHLNPPDFEKQPRELEKFPWAFLGAVWYWDTRKLNKYADRNDLHTITKKINGGFNGLKDRRSKHVRTSLVLLGYELKKGAIARFQADNDLTVDDIPGDRTMNVMHLKLKGGRVKSPDNSQKQTEKPKKQGFWSALASIFKRKK